MNDSILIWAMFLPVLKGDCVFWTLQTFLNEQDKIIINFFIFVKKIYFSEFMW